MFPEPSISIAVLSTVLPFALGFLATVLLTPLARRAALRLGVLDDPGPRKLHPTPVPYLGGLGVVSGIALTWTGWVLVAGGAPGGELRPPLVVLGGALVLMVVGLVDDVRGLSPRVRFLLQAAVTGAVLVGAGGFDVLRLGAVLFVEVHPFTAFALAGFWVLSITNAANMMDGMDGLASGVGALAAGVLAYLAAGVYGVPGMGLLLAVVAGAFAGFLVFNSAPARIFLGDAGSLPLGFLLGAGALYACTADGVLHAVPLLLVVGVPAMDLLLSVLRRGLAAVSVERLGGSRERFAFRLRHLPRFFEGDRGHLHHRLLERLGTVRRVVSALYLVGLGLGVLAIWAAARPEVAPMILVGTVILGLTTVAPFLHSELRVLETGVLLPLFHTRYVSRRTLHATWDAGVFVLAFVAAGWIGSRWFPGSLPEVGRAVLPGLIGPLVMSLLGLYRIHFRNAGAWSFWKAMAGTGSGVAAVVLVDTLVVGPPLATASALLFLYLALTGSIVPRAAYTFMAEAWARRPQEGRLTVIDGVGRIETALLERALADPSLDLRPVGFLHAGRELEGRWIRGFPVLESDDLGLERILREHGVEAVVTVDGEADIARISRLQLACRSVGAALLLYRESLAELVPGAPDEGVPEAEAEGGDGVEDRRASRSA